MRYPYDDVKEGYDRVTPLEVVSVTADPGTPAQYTRSSSGNDTTLRIGDADTLDLRRAHLPDHLPAPRRDQPLRATTTSST